MPIDEERLRRQLRQYDFDEAEIDELVARAIARDKVMTPEDKERMFMQFFEHMMEGIPYTWDAEGKLRYDQADMDRKRDMIDAQMEMDEDMDDDDLDEDDIARG
jgi:hypothetical protein